jgi:hypothetical protein
MTAGRHAFKNSKAAYAVGVFIISVFILLIAALVVLFGFAAIQTLNSEILDFVRVLRNYVLGAFVAFFIFFAAYVFKIPPEMQKKNEDDIDRLNKRLSLNEYDDIEVAFRDDPLTDHQLGLLGHSSNNFLKISLSVTNNGGIGIRCGLKMVSLQYNRTGYVQLARWEGDEIPSEREDSPKPIETKLMRWDEGYDTVEGKIYIPSRGGIGNLMLVETASRPNLNFWFLYIDGNSRNHHTMHGRYWAVLQLEGHCESDGKRTDLDTIQYEIEFTYDRNRLDPVGIKKLKRDKHEATIHNIIS